MNDSEKREEFSKVDVAISLRPVEEFEQIPVPVASDQAVESFAAYVFNGWDIEGNTEDASQAQVRRLREALGLADLRLTPVLFRRKSVAIPPADAPGVTLRQQLFACIEAELDRAYAKHGRDPWGRHEFYAILLEEVEEMWTEIKADGSDLEFYKELVQVAAMCFRYFETGDRYRHALPKRTPYHPEYCATRSGQPCDCHLRETGRV